MAIGAHRKIGFARDRGFTLMELLVVLTIFSTVVVASTDIFLLASRSQRKVFGLERTQADARYTMEAMTREIRTGAVDYAYYASRGAPIAVPESELALIDSANTRMKFHLSQPPHAECADAASSPCLLVTVGAGAAATITPKGVAVNNAKFYIAPLVDPIEFNAATGAYSANVQPRVTVVLVLRSTAERATEQSVVYLQTTATSRGYER